MPYTVDAVKEAVLLHIGEAVCCRSTNGRRKTEERFGVILDTFPKLFTVYVESQKSTVSFMYTDIMTKEVEVILKSTGRNIM